MSVSQSDANTDLDLDVIVPTQDHQDLGQCWHQSWHCVSVASCARKLHMCESVGLRKDIWAKRVLMTCWSAFSLGSVTGCFLFI